MVTDNQRIVCAAIRQKATGKILCGARHFDAIMQQWISDDELDGWVDADQGFIDQWGTFLTRQEAYQIAKQRDQFNGQDAPHSDHALFSEDLY